MRIPPLVSFTKLSNPETPPGELLLRVDSIMAVERAYLTINEKPLPGVTVKKEIPKIGGRRVEGTVLALGNGSQIVVEELVEEVHRRMKEATKPRLFGWLFA